MAQILERLPMKRLFPAMSVNRVWHAAATFRIRVQQSLVLVKDKRDVKWIKDLIPDADSCCIHVRRDEDQQAVVNSMMQIERV